MWAISKDYQGINAAQRYFIQQWGIQAEGGHPTLDQVLRYSTRQLLREIIGLIPLVEDGRVKLKTLEDLIDAITKHLDQNLLLKRCFADDVHLYKDLLRQNPELDQPSCRHRVTLASSALLKRLDTSSLIKTYVREVASALESGSPPFHEVRVFVETLFLELLTEGHSREHLRRWGLGVFVHDSEPNFTKRLNRIADNLAPTVYRPFTCILKLNLPKDPPEILHPFTRYHPGDSVIPVGQAERFFSGPLQYLSMLTQAADRTAAAEQAYRSLENRTMLWRYSNPNYESGISRSVLVIEDEDGSADLVRGVCKPQTFPLGNLPLFLKWESDPESDRETVDLVSRALHWARLSNESPGETGFVALWSALEALLAGPSGGVRSLADNVVNILSLGIMRDRLVFLWNHLKDAALRRDLKQTFASALREGSQIDETLFWEILINDTDQVLRLLGDKDEWVKAEVQWFAQARNEQTRRVHRFMKEYKENVAVSIRHMYRLRNLLAHQAVVSPQGIDTAMSTLVYCANKVFNSVLYVLSRNPKMTMSELLLSYELTSRLYTKCIREEPLASADLKNIVRPRLYFSTP